MVGALLWMADALETMIQMGVPLALAAGAITVLTTRRVLTYLIRRQIMDTPNERSSHTLPTPRGGGLATTPVLAVALVTQFIGLGLGALALLAISWVDDRKGLPPLPRFAAQAVVVSLFLVFLPSEQRVFQGALPVWADHTLTGLAWLWFVNLYNFMDGIDGITCVETISIAIGVAVLGGSALQPSALATGAVAGAFLLFNWHPAKLFLGDSGSVPLGFALGGLLVLLAIQGQLVAALILPAYYLADATITLCRRALNGEKVWQPHRKHFYQRAVQGGKRHDQVALLISGGNVLLIGCAVVATRGQPMIGVAGAVIVVCAVLSILQIWSKGWRP